jgi:hypothetical protein
VTYSGWPLYYYEKDSKAGDVKGENVDGTWFALSAAGQAVKQAAATSNSGASSGGAGF